MSVFDGVLHSLITQSPIEGRELAIKVARKTIAAIQPNEDIRHDLRSDYDSDSEKLMKAAQIVALEFQTIAAANNYWRD